jgi:CDP-diacylglycerol--glycerol-3-phosphate 3-phosphatidyltransferase/cardiolipin synthase
MPFNLPIFLTWLRILLIPLFVGVFYAPQSLLSATDKNILGAAIFAAAAATDWLDGYLARALGQTSAFGAFLDPVADKLMVAAALIVLVHLDRTESWIAVVIIGREITISALREWMAQIGAARSVAVHMLGKLKTTAQMVAIPFLLYDGLLFGVLVGAMAWLRAGPILVGLSAHDAYRQLRTQADKDSTSTSTPPRTSRAASRAPPV